MKCNAAVPSRLLIELCCDAFLLLLRAEQLLCSSAQCCYPCQIVQRLCNLLSCVLTYGVVVQCVCSCPVEFDNAPAPAPMWDAPLGDNSGMASAGRRLLSSDTNCGPVPTQYESFTQVSYTHA